MPREHEDLPQGIDGSGDTTFRQRTRHIGPAPLRRTGRLLAAVICLGPLLTGPGCENGAGDEPAPQSLGSVEVRCGDLRVRLLDNAESPDRLSGVDQLFHVQDAPEHDAFDPHDPPASAGLNFEHIISGHADPANWFAPRHGPYPLVATSDPHAFELVRRAQDDPWALESRMTYSVRAPHAIDFEFRCRAHDVSRFGSRGYAVLFWANYMNDVEDVALHFRGVDAPDGEEQWIAADAPETHEHYVGGGTYRSQAAPPLEYDDDHNLKLNVWSYDYPRFTRPFYYGRAAQGMTLILMFDKTCTPQDQIRFSLFKFKVGEQIKRPAWDFQYVIHAVEPDTWYGFRGRLVWKRFVSPEDCLEEYETWSRGLSAGQ
jgi:hypothetical protein